MPLPSEPFPSSYDHSRYQHWIIIVNFFTGSSEKPREVFDFKFVLYCKQKFHYTSDLETTNFNLISCCWNRNRNVQKTYKNTQHYRKPNGISTITRRLAILRLDYWKLQLLKYLWFHGLVLLSFLVFREQEKGIIRFIQPYVSACSEHLVSDADKTDLLQ